MLAARASLTVVAARNPNMGALMARWSNEHVGRRVDLMMRGLPCDPEDNPADAIRTWLASGVMKPGASPWHLRQKAVILVDPPERRGEVVWDPR
jgi:hypothetical protein